MAKSTKMSVFDTIRSNRVCRNGHNGDGKVVIDDLDAYPVLGSILTELPDASPKGTKFGKVSLFLYNGRLTACVSCPAMVASCFVTLESLTDAIRGIEAHLAKGDAKWQQDEPYDPKKAKR